MVSSLLFYNPYKYYICIIYLLFTKRYIFHTLKNGEKEKITSHFPFFTSVQHHDWAHRNHSDNSTPQDHGRSGLLLVRLEGYPRLPPLLSQHQNRRSWHLHLLLHWNSRPLLLAALAHRERERKMKKMDLTNQNLGKCWFD